jgi:hypothetical protein
MSPRYQSFLGLVVDTFSTLWIEAKSVNVGRMILVTFLWAAVAIAANVLTSLLSYQAQAAGVLRVGTLVFFLLITATWLVISYEQTRTEFGVHHTGRELAAGVIAMLPTLLIAGLLTWGVVAFSFVVLGQPLKTPVTNYATCVSGGGVVLDTDPRQCVTTQSTYVEGE